MPEIGKKYLIYENLIEIVDVVDEVVLLKTRKLDEETTHLITSDIKFFNGFNLKALEYEE